jgi:hypothetical protein
LPLQQGDKLRLILIYLLTQEEANSEARTSAGDSLLEIANLNHLGQVVRNLDFLAPPAPCTSPNSSSISAFLGTLYSVYFILFFIFSRSPRAPRTLHLSQLLQYLGVSGHRFFKSTLYSDLCWVNILGR